MSIEEIIRNRFKELSDKEWEAKKKEPPYNVIPHIALDAIVEYHPNWIKYNQFKSDLCPKDIGRYLVRKKGGDLSLNTWSGNKWCSDNDTIEYFLIIAEPND